MSLFVPDGRETEIFVPAKELGSFERLREIGIWMRENDISCKVGPTVLDGEAGWLHHFENVDDLLRFKLTWLG